MIGAIVAWSLNNRVLVALLVFALAAVGVRSYLTLPVDAVPDVTNVQVQVLTNAPGLSPIEVEQLVTRPVELALTGIPGATQIRSISRPAVSAVTIVFDDDVDLSDARTLVAQRLPKASEVVPASSDRPEMGPFTTALGEIYHFTVAWPGHSLKELRTVLDWDVALPLRSVPGVVEVNAWGGDERQIEARLRASDLRALGVSAHEVEEALLGGGHNAGGGAIERGGEQILVRLDGRYTSAEQVGAQVVRTREGAAPILVRDVATVKDGAKFRQSVATADGKGETIYVMVQMIAHGNARDVVQAVRERLDELTTRLPAGVVIEPFYDRAEFVERVLGTVQKSLLEGGGLVIVLLFIFLGDLGAGVVVATVIPLAMLGAFTLMRLTGVSGNLMSLGAIDFGLVVDGAIVVIEGTLATMAVSKLNARDALEEGGRTVGRAIAFGVFIIGIVYVPILLLEGVEGKTFRPMALTVLFALATALVLTFTWVPALASIVLRRAHEGDVFVIRWTRRVYRPFLDALMPRPWVATALAVVLIAVGVGAGLTRGAEFVPRLEEGDLVVQLTRPPSVSLAEAAHGTGDIERTLLAFPEVRRVVSRTGSPDVATDVMGLDMSDIFILLKPRGTWTTADTREGLVEAFEAALHKALPGATFGFTQPIEMRVQELLGGVKSDLGIAIHGDDLPTMRRLADEIAARFQATPGAADVRVEPTGGLPSATIVPNPVKMGRLGVHPDELRAAVETLRAGRKVGTFVDSERTFDVVLRVDQPPAAEAAELARTPILVEGGRQVLLGDVADVTVAEGPAQLSRQHGRRRVLVEGNVRGRDLATFVAELKERLSAIELPPRYAYAVTGQYENLVRATARLAIVVPATLLLIFVLLWLTFHEARSALLIFLNVPAAASGGLVALTARGLPLSISAAVGFIALLGVATMNGVVLLSSVRRREAAGADARTAALEGAHERLRPVLTTAVVASLGFLPMAIATGTGSEVQRPLATVVMGGLVTATLLTLGVLPTLYAWTHRKRAEAGSPS
jgi:cobalt-zinc-cadmium resistance protein CzcA